MMGEAYQASTGEVAQHSTLGTFRSICQKHGILGLFRGLPTRSMLHATVWCCVGLGREACERFGLRESAKRRSAERGNSGNLTA